MPTEPTTGTRPGAGPTGEVRRVALVLARHGAGAAAGPGLSSAALARAALTDSYEVLADLAGVRSGIAGPPECAALLWPGGLSRPDAPILELAASLEAEADELVVVPADVPDLPGLVLAKVFQVLHRTDVVVAPDRHVPDRQGDGCVALGLRLPVAAWLRGQSLDLDADPYHRLVAVVPGRGRVARSPGWHRLRTPADLGRLDPGLEGWETRALLAGPRVPEPSGRGAR